MLEKALKESRKFLETIIETEPECVKLVASDGTLIMMNRAGLDMIQVGSLDRAKGRSIYPLILPEYREAFVKLTEEVFQGRPGTLTFEMKGVKGRRLWLETHAVPLRNESNEIIALLGITRDVTGRKRDEATILEQKRFAENLVTNSAVATFVLSAQHRVLFWNKACEELTGKSAADMVGSDDHWKAFYDSRHPTLADILIDGETEQAASLYSVFAPSVLIPSGLRAEGWFPRVNNRDRYLAFDAAPVYDGKGALSVVIETIHDVTEHRKAEEALMQEKKFSDAVIDNLPGIFYICDERGSLIRWNKNVQEVTGYTGEELSRITMSGLFLEDRELVARKMKEVYDAGKAFAEARVLTKTGERIPFLLTAFRLLIHDERYLVCVGIDVSERKRLEDQLRHAQKMESIGTLAGGIAHDFNNILTAVIGYGNLLQKKIGEDQSLRFYTEQILTAANRAAGLTRGLLAYGRKQILNPQPVNLNEIIRNMENLLARLIGEDVELTSILSEKDLIVLADTGQIEQVLMNLATNARDAMPGGGSLYLDTGAIELGEDEAKAHGLQRAGAYALLTVSDTGTGMDEKTRERIFEPFYTTKEVGKGTGLGLAMVYGTIRQHNGSVEVESDPGKGAAFKIYLPLVQVASDASQPGVLPPIAGGTETILVAEDDEAVRNLTAGVLTQAGYTVIQAENGEAAVNKFSENRAAVRMLILDVIMPRKNGKEVYDKIRIFKPDIKA
ncbi:MAG TPA: PAS domain S-box protein, partial [Nitrospirota bacterium]|nr:PAS domain S-box protein [Nitrospirota bacterium]